MYLKSDIILYDLWLLLIYSLNEIYQLKAENETKHLHDPKLNKHFVSGKRKDTDVF